MGYSFTILWCFRHMSTWISPMYTCVSPHPEPSSHLLPCFPSRSTFFFSFKVYLVSHSSSVKIASYRTLLLYSSIFFPFFGFTICILMPSIDMFRNKQRSVIMITLCNLCLLRKQADRKRAHTVGPVLLACLSSGRSYFSYTGSPLG